MLNYVINTELSLVSLADELIAYFAYIYLIIYHILLCETFSELSNSLLMAGDGRTSSPGGSATYCTYTVMDNDTKEILSIVNMDNNIQIQQNSAILEKEAFIQTIDKLKQEIRIQEVCTDRNKQISALFSMCTFLYC